MAKAQSNYALNYIKQMLPAARSSTGDDDGQAIAARAAKLIGLQLYDETAELLGGIAAGADGFAGYLAAMLEGGGDSAEIVGNGGSNIEIIQTGWRLMAGSGAATSGDFHAWSNLWQGACACHDPNLVLRVEEIDPPAIPLGERRFRWIIAPG